MTLILSGGATIRIESTFDLAEAAVARTVIDPENVSVDLGLGSILRGRVVEAATADEDTGLLSINFVGGLVIRVPPDPDFEAWTTSWSDGSTVVALPGGGLSSWSGRA